MIVSTNSKTKNLQEQTIPSDDHAKSKMLFTKIQIRNIEHFALFFTYTMANVKIDDIEDDHVTMSGDDLKGHLLKLNLHWVVPTFDYSSEDTVEYRSLGAPAEVDCRAVFVDENTKDTQDRHGQLLDAICKKRVWKHVTGHMTVGVKNKL
jgi:hypothetical protein